MFRGSPGRGCWLTIYYIPERNPLSEEALLPPTQGLLISLSYFPPVQNKDGGNKEEWVEPQEPKQKRIGLKET